MVCWAAPEAEPVAGDDAKDIRWMTLPQLRGLNVSALLWMAARACVCLLTDRTG